MWSLWPFSVFIGRWGWELNVEVNGGVKKVREEAAGFSITTVGHGGMGMDSMASTPQRVEDLFLRCVSGMYSKWKNSWELASGFPGAHPSDARML